MTRAMFGILVLVVVPIVLYFVERSRFQIWAFIEILTLLGMFSTFAYSGFDLPKFREITERNSSKVMWAGVPIFIVSYLVVLMFRQFLG